MEKRCIIISGGAYDEALRPEEDDFVIACDKGYEYARRMGVRPDLLIADFDSYRGDVAGDIEVLRYPCEKDDTDTMAAVKYAVREGCEEICLLCALGGRVDHMYANLQAAQYAARRNVRTSILSDSTRILFLHNGEMVLRREEGYSLSVFSFSDVSRGVSISGTKYEVKDAELTSDFPIGQSNEWQADSVRIGVREGTLMIVESRLENTGT